MRLFFHTYSHKIFLYLFIAVFGAQVFFWFQTKDIKPAYNIIPNLPSANFLNIASFGDKEFLFRVLSLRIQNAGDVFAGFVSLKNYDYEKLYHWFSALDTLNEKSNTIPALATYYFAQTTVKADLYYILNYLDDRATRDLNTNWWWVFQEIYIAENSLNDKDLALKYAYKLSETSALDAPLWTKQMPAFVLARQGKSCLAFKVIERILQENEQGIHKISAEEMNFMRHFINERLSKLSKEKFDPRKCK